MLTEEEKRAEAIWTYCISREKVLKRLVEKNIMHQDLAYTLSGMMLEQLNVNEIPGFRRSSLGEAMIVKHIQVVSPDNTYMSLTKIARQKDAETPSYVIQSWLRNYGTIEFLRLWEKESNAGFKDEACEFNIWINPAFRLDVVKKFRMSMR